jgi:hypothetical protein
MAHELEHFGKQHADHGSTLDDKDAELSSVPVVSLLHPDHSREETPRAGSESAFGLSPSD